MRTVWGEPVCLTAWDAKGRAHLRDPAPGRFDWTLCGRRLDEGGVRGTKTCFACAEEAPAANARLRIL